MMRKTVVGLLVFISIFSMGIVSFANETDYSYLEDLSVRELRELRDAINAILGDEPAGVNTEKENQETDMFERFSTSMTENDVQRILGTEAGSSNLLSTDHIEFCGLDGRLYFKYRDDKDKTIDSIIWSAFLSQNYLTEYKTETDNIIKYYSEKYGEPDKTNFLEIYEDWPYDTYIIYEWEDDYCNSLELQLMQSKSYCDIRLVLTNNYVVREPVEEETIIDDAETVIEESLSDNKTDADSGDAVDDDKFVFTYNGIAINMKADFEPILKELGEYKNYTEEASSAFEGLDKNYVFSDFIITTYPDGNIDRVNSVTVINNNVSTVDGLCIGDTQDKVDEIYGHDYFNGINAYIMKSTDAQLTIILGEDNNVFSIQYAAVLE